MEEKRKFVRLDTDKLHVAWRKEGMLDNMDSVKNISGGGVCLFLGTKELNENDFIQMEFHLPEKKVIHAKGKVAWVNRMEIMGEPNKSTFEAGVEFLEISASDQELIKAYVFSSLAQIKAAQKNPEEKL